MAEPIKESNGAAFMDRFERARENLIGNPGYQHKTTTITDKGQSLIPSGTWVIETIDTEDGTAIFLQKMSSDGGMRIALPTGVCKAIYAQHQAVIKKRKSVRGKKAMETRMSKGFVPTFGRNKKVEEPEPGNKA